MSARAYQVGDRVRITGWGSYGPHEGIIIGIQSADPDGRSAPYIVLDTKFRMRDGQIGQACCSMTTDVTGVGESWDHTVELLEAADGGLTPTDPSGGAVTQPNPAPSDDTTAEAAASRLADSVDGLMAVRRIAALGLAERQAWSQVFEALDGYRKAVAR